MRHAKTLAALVLLTAAPMLPGCDDEPRTTPPGADPAALVDIEQAGDRCPGGGVLVHSGLDRNANGVLEADEIQATQALCNDAPVLPPEPDSLVRVDDEPRGANCPFGGRVIRAGVDRNRDGALQDDEITDTAYACDPVETAGFSLLARYQIPTGTAAEIVAVSPDGKLLAYTNSALGTVELVDLANPAQPAYLGEIVVSDAVAHPGAGQPTSVAITPNGQYAVVAVKDTTEPIGQADPGALVLIELTDPANLRMAGTVTVGVGPDSVDITPDGKRVVVAIEDEEDTDQAAVAQARPGSVQVVTLDYADPARSAVATVALALTLGNNASDPQPEYVDISADGATAVVSLQENNALAIIDLTAEPPVVSRYLDAGVVTRFTADVADDGLVAFAPTAFAGRREPDGVCFLSDGVHVVTANEGDTETDDFVAGQLSGGRGFSIFSIHGFIHGGLVFDIGDELERMAARHGMYPDSRSDSRGIEVEGCHVARFGDRELAFVLGERNSMVAVYDVTDPAMPVFVQLLPAPLRPESAVSVPDAGLLIVAGEGDDGTGGGIWIFASEAAAEDRERYPAGVLRAVTQVDGISFGSFSGAAWDAAAGVLVAVSDNTYAVPRLWTMKPDAGGRYMRVLADRPLTEADGITPLAGYDPEGLAVNPEGGLVIATEGKKDNGTRANARNRLMFVHGSGVLDATRGQGGFVDLPVDLWPRLPGQGLSGVAVVDTAPEVPGGLHVFVSFQRPLDAGADNVEAELGYSRIGVYDVDAASWAFYFYPLDSELVADLVHLGGQRLAVLERDQHEAGAARIKRIHAVDLASATPDSIEDPLDKTLLVDLLAQPFRFDFEKAEALAIDQGTLWIASDSNGGAQATWLMTVVMP